MAIQTLHDTGSEATILSKYDGGVYGTALSDCICRGIGDEFTINYQSDSLNVFFNAGSEAIVGGSFFKITSLESITLTPNATIYLCANIDLSKPNLQRGAFVQRTSSNMRSDNINGNGTSRDLLLYVITTGTNGVISVQDKRVIRGDGTSISGIELELQNNQLKVSDGNNALTFKALTQAQYNAITTKDNHTLYFVYEE